MEKKDGKEQQIGKQTNKIWRKSREKEREGKTKDIRVFEEQQIGRERRKPKNTHGKEKDG